MLLVSSLLCARQLLLSFLHFLLNEAKQSTSQAQCDTAVSYRAARTESARGKPTNSPFYPQCFGIGLSPKSNSGALSPTPQATSSAFITNFPDNPKKICIKDPAAQGAVKHHGEIYFSFDRVFWTECPQEEIFQARGEATRCCWELASSTEVP